ncbi:hypothetical protein ACL90Y_01830 [Micrococcus luteus]
MPDTQSTDVGRVSRGPVVTAEALIVAPAAALFALLSDPARHPAIDGGANVAALSSPPAGPEIWPPRALGGRLKESARPDAVAVALRFPTAGG